MVEELVNLITKIAGVLSANRAGELLVAAWGGNTWSRHSFISFAAIYIMGFGSTSIGLDAMRTLLLNLSFLAKDACINLCHPVGQPQFQLQFQLQFATVASPASNPSWPLGRT